MKFDALSLVVVVEVSDYLIQKSRKSFQFLILKNVINDSFSVIQ